MERRLSWLEPAGFAVALAAFLLGAPAGTTARGTSPLGDLLGWVPGAVVAAALLAGVIFAARAILPKDPVAGAIGAIVLGLAPPVLTELRTPALLAACGAVWAIAFAARARPQVAIAMCGVAIGSSPWFGIALAVVIAIWARPPVIALAVLFAVELALWLGMRAPLPAFAIALPGAPIVVGAGVLGAGFGALTGLPRARWLLAAIAVATIDDLALLGLCAVGIAVIPSAVVRVVGSDHRNRVAIAAGVPLVGAAIAALQ